MLNQEQEAGNTNRKISSCVADNVTNLKGKFTPGPWTVQPDPEWAGKHPYHDHRFITSGPDAINSDEWLENDANSILCSMRDCPNQEANARLIASAPDLAKALQSMCENLESRAMSKEQEEAFERSPQAESWRVYLSSLIVQARNEARQAIAKAEGL